MHKREPDISWTSQLDFRLRFFPIVLSHWDMNLISREHRSQIFFLRSFRHKPDIFWTSQSDFRLNLFGREIALRCKANISRTSQSDFWRSSFSILILHRDVEEICSEHRSQMFDLLVSFDHVIALRREPDISWKSQLDFRLSSFSILISHQDIRKISCERRSQIFDLFFFVIVISLSDITRCLVNVAVRFFT